MNIPITHDTSKLPCVASITPQYESDGVSLKLDGQANTSNIMCVSKARIGDYICDLPLFDMKAIDEALAKTLGLMKYYSDLSQKLNEKLIYIEKLKQQRNTAQDHLSAISGLFQLNTDEDLIIFFEDLKKNLDNPHKSL